MAYKQNRMDISLFVISGSVILFLFVSLYLAFTDIKKERIAMEKETELRELSHKLADASDYLTSEVRKFCVTLNPIHLRNYWTEINVTKSRENVISRLKELNTPLNEFDLLNEAKNNSDNLVNTETQAMKLVLQVYEVPEDQLEPAIRDYQLTLEDEKLSFNGKVNLAREILYNKKYEADKRKIMEPISKFQKTMMTRIHKETQEAYDRTDRHLYILILASLFIAIYLLYLAWFLFSRVSVPMKNFILQASKDSDDANTNARYDNALTFIKNLQKSISKRT